MPDSRHDVSLEEVARETLSIVAHGGYRAPSGAYVDLSLVAKAAVAGTRTFESDELDRLLDAAIAGNTSSPARVEVTLETTQQAAYRLFVEEEVDDLAALNFASATRAGGGFMRGARAQEEDIARCSALYSCLKTQTEFYALHRMSASPLYSDRMIHSPRVPFFRVRSDELLERTYEVSVITAAAPNARRVLEARASDPGEIEAIFRRRTGKVLALAEAKGHRSLVLGAWGCGVFGNDPEMAADSFGTWLEAARFRGSFDRVVFAVYDPRPGRPSHTVFSKRLSP
jgi:uncharacterized protein (TIGR02452 family)